MSVFDRSVQKDILRQVRRAGTVESIIRDIIDEQTERAMEMRHLHNRYKKRPATNYDETRLPLQFDGVPIYARRLPNTKLYKVNLRLHHPFDVRIVQTFTGYMANDVSLSIDEDRIGEQRAQEANEFLTDLEHLNNGESLRSRLTEHAVRSWTAGVLLYWDGDIRMMSLRPWAFAVIYDTMTDEPQYALRWWKERTDDENNPEQTVAEWYDRRKVSTYETDRYGAFQPEARLRDAQTGEMTQSMLHLFDGHVPVVEYPKNPERVGDVELSLSLQDAYDIAISDLASELSQFRHSYIVWQDQATQIDRELIETMRQTGIIGVGVDGKVTYLERNVNAAAHFQHAEQLKENVFLMSNSVDFSQISGETRIMGLEMRMKPLDESAKTTAQMFTTSLRRTYNAIADFANTFLGQSIDARALDWVFTFNRPSVRSEEIENFVATDGLMADEDRFRLLTFVDDPMAYVERLENQRRERAAQFIDEPADVSS